MRTLPLTLMVIFLVAFDSGAQIIKLQENFESTDSIPPVGWFVYNEAPFPIEPGTNWTVRDTGLALPGLATARSRAHSGRRAIGVSWVAGVDTATGMFRQSDCWLVSPRIRNVQVGDVLKFWATGGSTNFLDSLQIWILGTDSIPSTIEFHFASIVWPVGSTYGQFAEYTYDLSIAAGVDFWLAFRYFQDVTVEGFFVHLDDVTVEGPSSVSLIDGELPRSSQLKQNYPNPFNPATTIEFDVAQGGYATLKVFDLLGKEKATLVAEELGAGTYSTRWDASGFASGTYYYRLEVQPSGEYASRFVETKRLIFLK